MKGEFKKCQSKIKRLITYPTENITSSTSVITEFDKDVHLNYEKKNDTNQTPTNYATT